MRLPWWHGATGAGSAFGHPQLRRRGACDAHLLQVQQELAQQLDERLDFARRERIDQLIQEFDQDPPRTLRLPPAGRSDGDLDRAPVAATAFAARETAALELIYNAGQCPHVVAHLRTQLRG